jgi:hypothetical protein
MFNIKRKIMRKAEITLVLALLFLLPIYSMAQDSVSNDGNTEIVGKVYDRKEEVSKIIHGKNRTRFQRSLSNLVIKYVSKFRYGTENRLSIAEESLIRVGCRTEREAAPFLGEYLVPALFTMPADEYKRLIKEIDDQLKIIRRLRTPIEIEADKLGL